MQKGDAESVLITKGESVLNLLSNQAENQSLIQASLRKSQQCGLNMFTHLSLFNYEDSP